MATSVGALLNLPRLEQLFGQLMARLAEQEAELASLRTRVAEHDAQGSRILSLEAALLRLDTTTAVAGGGSVGRRCGENGVAVARLADVVDDLRREVRGAADDGADGAAALADRVARVEADYARADYAVALEARCAALARGLEATNVDVGRKVDAADAAGLAATCARLRSVDGFVAESRGRLGSLESRAHASDVASGALLERTDAAAAAAAAALAAAAVDRAKVDALAAGGAAASEAVDARLAAKADAAALASAAAVAEGAAAECVELRRSLGGGADAAAEAADAESARVEALVSAAARDAASALAASDAAGRRRLDAAVRALLAPPSGPVAECRRRLAALEAGADAAGDKLGVALKFVDWFSDRGAAYEHNMRAIDRRLSGMVAPERPDLEPFSGELRVSPGV